MSSKRELTFHVRKLSPDTLYEDFEFLVKVGKKLLDAINNFNSPHSQYV